jgi:hypothetical protein
MRTGCSGGVTGNLVTVGTARGYPEYPATDPGADGDEAAGNQAVAVTRLAAWAPSRAW